VKKQARVLVLNKMFSCAFEWLTTKISKMKTTADDTKLSSRKPKTTIATSLLRLLLFLSSTPGLKVSVFLSQVEN
jgi:hypothetical protein